MRRERCARCPLHVIPLRHVLGPAIACARAPWRAIVLVKPQFQAQPDAVGKGGVVRDERVHASCIARVALWCIEHAALTLLTNDI